MKNITKLLMAFLCLGILFTACNKDNFDWDAYYKQQEEAIKKEKARQDSLYKDQAPILEAYAKQKWGDAAMRSDSSLSKGIWYKIEYAKETATPYTYGITLTNNGPMITPFSATFNFKGELMDGTVFDKNPAGTPAVYTNIYKAIDIYNVGWMRAFTPPVIKQDGRDYYPHGLLPKGLQKGDKITFIAPSYYTFDQTEYTKGSEKVTVPKNTPVVYTIELVTIGAATSN
jgi:hypothetical protein